ncbi:hypothetical protein [Cohnella abietis]|uniref:Beta-carotene 15,15'-monooxygenase n=1 Tax=Cohnella abietis TaxID=2507935 RepID=A0A3T1CYT9_9BACL|nr:hypothetical protein [Cohnella abietis]BBI31023.1 hypothetical protein KCTCHS21_04220 [Cohnella abietis]
MAIQKLQRSYFWFLALTMLILLTDTLTVRSFSLADQDPVLVYALMFDFMLVIPFLYWLFILRKKGKSITKIIPLPLLGALVVWLVLPVHLRGSVWSAVWPVELLLLAVELAFVGYEIRIIYRVVKRFRRIASQEPNTGEALRIAVHEEIGQRKLASLLLHDISWVYFLFFSWRTKPNIDVDGSPVFTYHKKTNQVLYSAILTKIIILEGIAVHLLLQQWSHWAAWVMTIADIWLLALVWGDCRASALQPVSIKGNYVRLRYGLRIQADIPLEDIANVTSALEFHPDTKELKNSATSLIPANIRIELKQPTKVEGLLFMPRQVTTIYMALDEPEAFAQELRKYAGHN